jgi:hypothetical protein
LVVEVAKHTDEYLLLTPDTVLNFRAANEKGGIVKEIGQTYYLETIN